MNPQVRNQPNVLVVGCEVDRFERLATLLRREGLRVSWAECGRPAHEVVSEQSFDVVVLFACASGEDGLRVLTAAKAQHCYAEFVVVAHDDLACGAVAAFRGGAFDYHSLSSSDNSLLVSIESALARASLHREVARLRRRLGAITPGGIVGRSRNMEQVFDLIERVAPTGVGVLVSGETGTGKELVARAIHEMSPRLRKGFVPVSCATVPEHLMESLLFGHVRGAFTGAVESRRGLFEHAPGGTVFLDEIDSMEIDLQAKLLRVLEERTIRRVGDGDRIPVDFRLISASNRDLREQVDRGEFREDLYFRLNTFPIHLPPLRERPEDIPLLAVHFRDRFARETGMARLTIHQCCMQWLSDYSWPGNVRELKNTIERAMLMSLGQDRITCSSLMHLGGGLPTQSWTRPLAEGWTLRRLEREYIGAVLESTEGHKGRAAELLGIDRRTLYRKLAEFEDEGSASFETDRAHASSPGVAY